VLSLADEETNMGFFGYKGSEEGDDIFLSDFIWPISGDFRFDVAIDFDNW